MKIKLVAVLFLLVAVLSSCAGGAGDSSGKMDVLPYYDLKGLIEQELPKLDGKTATLTSRVNGVEELTEKTFTTEQWRDELGAFFEADINKPSLIDSYTTELQKDILIHRAKPGAKTTIKEIMVRIVDDRPIWVTFKGSSESMFYTSFINGGIYMNNREDRIDHFEIESTQKIWFLKPNNMKIQGAVK